MRIVQYPNRDGRQDAPVFNMTGHAGLSMLNNIRMKTGHIRFRPDRKFFKGMTGQAFLWDRTLKGFMTGTT
jgi:hypothetical protein